MHERTTVRTLDLVDLDFELAGLGSRMAAYFIDAVILILTLIGLLIAFLMIAYGQVDSELAGSVGGAVYFLLAFLIQWGYFIIFELGTSGRTPGKWVMGLRVIRDNGAGVGFTESALRNLLRVVDMLPPPAYLVGLGFIVGNAKGKRLGDMAAGTLVVIDRFDHVDITSDQTSFAADWAAGVEQGDSAGVLSLPRGKVSAQQLLLVNQYLERRYSLDKARRYELSQRIAGPFIELLGIDAAKARTNLEKTELAENALLEVQRLAAESRKGPRPGARGRRAEQGRAKQKEWQDYLNKIRSLRRAGMRALGRLNYDEFTSILRSFRRVTGDLARAKSLGADTRTINSVNRLAVLGHGLLYTSVPAGNKFKNRFLSRFPQLVRKSAWPVAASAFLFFAPAFISGFAVYLFPELAYDIVAEGFLHFEPTSEEHLHEIPALARPVASSQIITNNIQVTLLCFGFGLTFGLGTVALLIFNGVHIGAVAGWMAVQGREASLIGWILPHGFTEILAIVLAGGAGFVLAWALINPDDRPRIEALKLVAPQALIIELGCMIMLIIAGLIEGFISPSDLSLEGRYGVLALSVIVWGLFFTLMGRMTKPRPRPRPDL